MDLFALILFGVISGGIVLYSLWGRGRFYEFPFWVSMIALGWFYPQAIGGYVVRDSYPGYAYSDALLFASLCIAALFAGFNGALHKVKSGLLSIEFNPKRLYWSGVGLCLFGFYFQWKLFSLPDEVLAVSQWSGVAVKYLFLANVFKIGFLILWISYLRMGRLVYPKYLIFIIPCMLLFLEAAVMRGRRAGMMDLVSYVIVGLWFCRGIQIPRWFLVSGLVGGLVFINGIHHYRVIMSQKDLSLTEKLSEAANTDYMASSKKRMAGAGIEFSNYVYYRYVIAEERQYDYGAVHWNRFVFNYVPAQVVGREFKDNLYFEYAVEDYDDIAEREYNHSFKLGSTETGFTDAFGSFGWFGFIKFALIGYLMGRLYSNAIRQKFLGQLLYLYCLTVAMQCVSHGTNDILIRVWIYFFTFGMPVLYFARNEQDQPV